MIPTLTIEELRSIIIETINNSGAAYPIHEIDKLLGGAKSLWCKEQRYSCYLNWKKEKFHEPGYIGLNEQFAIMDAPELE